MSTFVPLELTHHPIHPGGYLWAIYLHYRPGIIGEVVAHYDGNGNEPRDWDWSVHPVGGLVAAYG